MTKSSEYLCRNCGEEIALIPEWPLGDGKQWHHVRATDEDTMGRYAIDCPSEDGFEAQL